MDAAASALRYTLEHEMKIDPEGIANFDEVG